MKKQLLLMLFTTLKICLSDRNDDSSKIASVTMQLYYWRNTYFSTFLGHSARSISATFVGQTKEI